MENTFFIPDINGFTSLAKKVEIEHSQHIINELVEIIINTNPIKLTVTEIEGDTVFYNFTSYVL